MDNLQRVERDARVGWRLAIIARLEVAPDSEYWGTERDWRAPVDADSELVLAVRDHIAELRTRWNVAHCRPVYATTGRALLHTCHHVAARSVEQLDQRTNRYGWVVVDLADHRSTSGLRDRERRAKCVGAARGPDSIAAVRIYFTQLRPAVGGVGSGDAIDSWVEEVHRAVAAGEEVRVRETTFELGVRDSRRASGRADWQLQ